MIANETTRHKKLTAIDHRTSFNNKTISKAHNA